MRRIDHPLLSESIGSNTSITSLHFGKVAAGEGRPKVYLQASLHAEELPGMLALHHLIPMLQNAQAAGQLLGEVVVVPVANPVGLAQSVDHKPMGRFELNSSENFNRHYPDLAQAIWPEVRGLLGQDEATNIRLIRDAAKAWVANWKPTTRLDSLRKTLVGLAVDADVVLDLHCDCEAVLHLYAEPQCWPALEPLARWLGARAVLLADGGATRCFDEVLSGLWRQLGVMAQAEGLAAPVPAACASTTVELRGEGDVSHALANADAQAIFKYLSHLGVIGRLDPAAGPGEPPPLPCMPTPLAGAQSVNTPVPGVLVFAVEPGQWVQKGDLIAEVINPLAPPDQQVHRVLAEVDGVFYARTRDRYALTNHDIGNVAGAVAYKTGTLLGY